MGFSKFAKARMIQPAIAPAAWEEIRQQGLALGPSFEARSASRVVLQEYNPEQFLLSHCSIIASVDAEPGPGLIGRQKFDGVEIERRYADYHITPETSKYVNNNHDAWERKLLLSCFRTFVGGENYVEHVQIPELSKGKIIDAAARDIGDSIYVDILVATDKKHASLIKAITSGQLSTLSMGAQVAFTICTKCGNVAEDEIQLCPHIRYLKGRTFRDASGKERKIAELCGHLTAEPGSVKFIEASWVANPAFPGAVLRNILDPATLGNPEVTQRMIQVAFSEPARSNDPLALQKAASLGRMTPARQSTTISSAEDVARAIAETTKIHRPVRSSSWARLAQFGDAPAEQAAPPAPEKEEKGTLDEKSDELYETLVEKVTDKVRKDLDGGNEKTLDENRSNQSLINSALKNPDTLVAAIWRKRAGEVLKMAGKPSIARTLLAGLILYYNGGWEALRDSKRFTGREVLAVSHLVDRMTKRSSLAGEARIYSTVAAVGGAGQYKNVHDYLMACRKVVGRELTGSEKSELVLKGKLFSFGS